MESELYLPDGTTDNVFWTRLLKEKQVQIFEFLELPMAM